MMHASKADKKIKITHGHEGVVCVPAERRLLIDGVLHNDRQQPACQKHPASHARGRILQRRAAHRHASLGRLLAWVATL